MTPEPARTRRPFKPPMKGELRIHHAEVHRLIAADLTARGYKLALAIADETLGWEQRNKHRTAAKGLSYWTLRTGIARRHLPVVLCELVRAGIVRWDRGARNCTGTPGSHGQITWLPIPLDSPAAGTTDVPTGGTLGTPVGGTTYQARRFQALVRQELPKATKSATPKLPDGDSDDEQQRCPKTLNNLVCNWLKKPKSEGGLGFTQEETVKACGMLWARYGKEWGPVSLGALWYAAERDPKPDDMVVFAFGCAKGKSSSRAEFEVYEKRANALLHSFERRLL